MPILHAPYANHFYKFARLVLLSLIVLLTTCAQEDDDEVQIHALIDGAVTAIESRNNGDFMKFISDDFQSSTLDSKTKLRAFVHMYLLRNPKISIVILDRDTLIDGDAAIVNLSALVAGHGSEGAIIPERGDHLDIRIELQKNGQWQVVAAYW